LPDLSSSTAKPSGVAEVGRRGVPLPFLGKDAVDRRACAPETITPWHDDPAIGRPTVPPRFNEPSPDTAGALAARGVHGPGTNAEIRRCIDPDGMERICGCRTRISARPSIAPLNVWRATDACLERRLRQQRRVTDPAGERALN